MHCLQVVGAVLLSLAYNGNVFRSALGVGAGMLHIYKTAAVSDTFPVPIWMRCMAAVVTASGAFLGGGRLMPVTGVTSAPTLALTGTACTSGKLAKR